MTAQPTYVPAAEPPVRTSLRVLWLAGLVYAVAASTHPGAHGWHLAAAILTATTAAGWLAWLAARHRHNLIGSYVGIVIVAASGGVLVVLGPIGVAVIGIAGLSAASLMELIPAAALVVPGIAAAAIAVAVSDHTASVIGGAASGAAAGLAIGMGRRQATQRVRQEAELAMAHERTELEHERAEVLAERNRLAREVHDVLAHTLSALAVQMEALSSVVEDGAPAAEVGELVAKSRRLVTEGLDETRRAVRVLREEPVDVADQIRALGDDGTVTIKVEGTPHEIAPAAGLALVRVAQEAVTNSRKHAVGSVAAIAITFTGSTVELTVENDRADASPLAATGAGYGLQGMRERLELVNGSLSAGPTDRGWRVHAVVPA